MFALLWYLNSKLHCCIHYWDYLLSPLNVVSICAFQYFSFFIFIFSSLCFRSVNQFFFSRYFIFELWSMHESTASIFLYGSGAVIWILLLVYLFFSTRIILSMFNACSSLASCSFCGPSGSKSLCRLLKIKRSWFSINSLDLTTLEDRAVPLDLGVILSTRLQSRDGNGYAYWSIFDPFHS